MSSLPETSFFYFVLRNVDSVGSIEDKRAIPYLDLTWCIEGKMVYVYEGVEYTLESGDAILFPKGSLRIRRAGTTPALYSSLNVNFTEDFTPEVCGVLRKSLRSDTLSILESMRRAYTSLGSEKNEKCTALFFYLYYQLVETAKENEHPHIKHIKKYIASHLTEKITLSEIADEVHLVPHYCCALFSKHEGMSIVDFILSRRIELAKSLIITDTLTLSKVAEHVGFTDYNYFSRIFKKVTGMTATQYKKAKQPTFDK